MDSEEYVWKVHITLKTVRGVNLNMNPAELRVKSQLVKDTINYKGSFLFTTASRTALEPTQPPIQWVI
jgi:hypothetical protein